MKSRIALGSALTIVPILGLALDRAGVVPARGGHGLGEWMFDSACFALLFLSM